VTRKITLFAVSLPSLAPESERGCMCVLCYFVGASSFK
jgi:hypothetical protein